jgi:hypothetical protein
MKRRINTSPVSRNIKYGQQYKKFLLPMGIYERNNGKNTQKETVSGTVLRYMANFREQLPPAPVSTLLLCFVYK